MSTATLVYHRLRAAIKICETALVTLYASRRFTKNAAYSPPDAKATSADSPRVAHSPPQPQAHAHFIRETGKSSQARAVTPTADAKA